MTREESLLYEAIQRRSADMAARHATDPAVEMFLMLSIYNVAVNEEEATSTEKALVQNKTGKSEKELKKDFIEYFRNLLKGNTPPKNNTERNLVLYISKRDFTEDQIESLLRRILNI